MMINFRVRLPDRILVFVILFFVLGTAQRMYAQEEREEDEGQASWTFSLQGSYQSRRFQRGIDLSESRPTVGYSMGVLHEKGFSLNLGATSFIGDTSGLLSWGAGLGYEITLNEELSVSIELNHTAYSNDSLNAVAGLSNMLSVEAAIDLKFVDISLSYDAYFGGGSATYYGMSVSSFLQEGDFTFVPSLDISFVSQTVDEKRLASFRRGLKTPTSGRTTTITGLSGIRLDLNAGYDLGAGFKVSFDPAYVISRDEIAAKTRQLIWSVSARYSADF